MPRILDPRERKMLSKSNQFRIFVAPNALLEILFHASSASFTSGILQSRVQPCCATKPTGEGLSVRFGGRWLEQYRPEIMQINTLCPLLLLLPISSLPNCATSPENQG